MNRTTAWIICGFFSTSALLHGQEIDFKSLVNQEGKAEAQAIWEGLTDSGTSVVDNIAKTGDSLAPITGNDYVEGALGKGVQALGGGALGELPIADGSAVLGSVAGGDYKAAADTAVAGTMGAIAGWGAGSLVTSLIAGGVITVSGPAWVPGVIVGGTVAWLTKSAMGWILSPDPPDSPSGSPRKPNPGTKPPKSPAKFGPNPSVGRGAGDHSGSDRNGGGSNRSGCSDGH